MLRTHAPLRDRFYGQVTAVSNPKKPFQLAHTPDPAATLMFIFDKLYHTVSGDQRPLSRLDRRASSLGQWAVTRIDPVVAQTQMGTFQ